MSEMPVVFTFETPPKSVARVCVRVSQLCFDSLRPRGL